MYYLGDDAPRYNITKSHFLRSKMIRTGKKKVNALFADGTLDEMMSLCEKAITCNASGEEIPGMGEFTLDQLMESRYTGKVFLIENF